MIFLYQVGDHLIDRQRHAVPAEILPVDKPKGLDLFFLSIDLQLAFVEVEGFSS